MESTDIAGSPEEGDDGGVFEESESDVKEAATPIAPIHCGADTAPLLGFVVDEGLLISKLLLGFM